MLYAIAKRVGLSFLFFNPRCRIQDLFYRLDLVTGLFFHTFPESSHRPGPKPTERKKGGIVFLIIQASNTEEGMFPLWS